MSISYKSNQRVRKSSLCVLSIRLSICGYMDMCQCIKLYTKYILDGMTLYKYYILYGMTWYIVTPRKHCRPRRSRGRQCFPRDDYLPCHPVKNVIFILLCRMSQVPSQIQLCVIRNVCASGNILLECYPLLWRRTTFYLNVTRCYEVVQNATTSAIGFSIWTVRASFSRSQHFFWMLPSSIYPL